MSRGNIEISTDTLMDLIMFDDIDTANAKLAPLYLTAVPVEGKSKTFDILTIFGGYICTLSPDSFGKIASDPRGTEEAGAALTTAQEDSDREGTVEITSRPTFRSGAGPMKYKSDYRGAVKEGETDHDARELEKSFREMMSDPNSVLCRLLKHYASSQPWDESPIRDSRPGDLYVGESEVPRARFRSYDGAAPTVSSTSDDRVVNNVVRHEYRVLSDAEKASMKDIKDRGQAFIEAIETLGKGREYSLAVTKVQEAVMWAVSGLTK